MLNKKKSESGWSAKPYSLVARYRELPEEIRSRNQKQLEQTLRKNGILKKQQSEHTSK